MNDELNDFFQQRVNYALVLNCNLQTVDKLRHLFTDKEDVHVIYQKVSLGKLFIKAGRDDG